MLQHHIIQSLISSQQIVHRHTHYSQWPGEVSFLSRVHNQQAAHIEQRFHNSEHLVNTTTVGWILYPSNASWGSSVGVVIGFQHVLLL